MSEAREFDKPAEPARRSTLSRAVEKCLQVFSFAYLLAIIVGIVVYKTALHPAR